MTNRRSVDGLLFTQKGCNFSQRPTYGSIDHTASTCAYFHLRVILIMTERGRERERERDREILIWLHSIHSFSNKFPNEFSAKYFPTVTIDFTSVAIFKPQHYNDTLNFEFEENFKKE